MADAAAYLPAVQAVIAEQIGIEAEGVAPTAALVHDLRCDSLDAVELAIGVENRFGVEITDAEIEALRTVGDILALLAAKGARP